MTFMSRAVRTLLLIPLMWAALASTPVFADTVIIRQAPARVVIVQAPPPGPRYYGHWGYGYGPRGYWPHGHYYGYGYGYGQPHGPYWNRGHYWR